MSRDEIDAILFRKRMPAIAMLRTAEQSTKGTPGCWFGGSPTLPAEIEWPIFDYVDGATTYHIPMHFLVQFNLALVPRGVGLPRLPRNGTLFVFLDPEVAAWGDRADSAGMTRGTGLRVIHVSKDVSDCPRRAPPPMPDMSDLIEWEVSPAYQGTQSFRYWPFEFAVMDTYAYSDDPLIPNSIPVRIDGMAERLYALAEERDDALTTQVGGYPSHPIRRAVRKHYIFGATNKTTFPSMGKRKKETDPYLTDDHILLFHFTDDPEIDFNVYDGHSWGFWIPRKELEQGVFDNVVAWIDYW